MADDLLKRVLAIPLSSVPGAQLDFRAGHRAAAEAYLAGGPVIVLSNEDDVLHGGEDLRSIIMTQASIHCTVLRMDISADDWAASAWPKVFATARQAWLQGRWVVSQFE